MIAAATFTSWLADLDARHRRATGLSSREFLKALRALSVRYVERRDTLAGRSPLDSEAKRAAFAAFYAPLHFLITRHVVNALGLVADPADPIEALIDLGCGTGATGAAVASAQSAPPPIGGIDREAWVLDEARRTWRHFGLDGRARRADLVDVAAETCRIRPRARATSAPGHRAIVAGWSINEIDPGARRRLLAVLATPAAAGLAILIVEPLARRAAPWWDDWADALRATGGRADEWRFEMPLPAPLAEWDEAAGFRRDGLTARSLWRPASRRPGLHLDDVRRAR